MKTLQTLCLLLCTGAASAADYDWAGADFRIVDGKLYNAATSKLFVSISARPFSFQGHNLKSLGNLSVMRTDGGGSSYRDAPPPDNKVIAVTNVTREFLVKHVETRNGDFRAVDRGTTLVARTNGTQALLRFYDLGRPATPEEVKAFATAYRASSPPKQTNATNRPNASPRAPNK